MRFMIMLALALHHLVERNVDGTVRTGSYRLKKKK